jgi:hypothetical protein
VKLRRLVRRAEFTNHWEQNLLLFGEVGLKVCSKFPIQLGDVIQLRMTVAMHSSDFVSECLDAVELAAEISMVGVLKVIHELGWRERRPVGG